MQLREPAHEAQMQSDSSWRSQKELELEEEEVREGALAQNGYSESAERGAHQTRTSSCKQGIKIPKNKRNKQLKR